MHIPNRESGDNMSDFDSVIEICLRTKSLSDQPATTAIDTLGTWVDSAWIAQRVDALRHIVSLADTIQRSAATEMDQTLFDYYLGNAWNGLKCLRGPHTGGSWDWEQNEIENEFICLRRAIRSPGFASLPLVRRTQIFTNLANCLNTTGRFVEAIETWDGALALDEHFGMARANRAIGLWHYAQALYDPSHAAILASHAWHQLDPSGLHGLEPGSEASFAATRRNIASVLSEEHRSRATTLLAQEAPLGDESMERGYRKWCLAERLFLNPLNDLGDYSIASRDVLTPPSIVTPIGTGPRYHGFFNQIKQEYCSARWLFYESRTQEGPHFADREVLIYNTLDYPSYSVATEKLKLAFRSLYSLFDKVAYFLNAYMALKIPERRISFRGIWYVAQTKHSGIRPEFASLGNWPLRGLYWVGKDLFETRTEFRATIDPDAERLADIRNHLEHKYLKLHLPMWTGPVEPVSPSPLGDDLAVSLHRDDFERITMRLMRLIRAALIYLVLGVRAEEIARSKTQSPGSVIPPMFLDTWEDNWKV